MAHFRLSPWVNQRLLFVMAFGFSSGLPLALSGSTLQAWLTEAHLSLMAIGVLSLASFPYNLKFLWAPLLDRFIFAGLGRRKGWILLTQACLALALLLLSFMHPESQLKNMGWLVLFMTFAGATQDIAVDAYRADVLLPPERGLGAAYFIFAYRMAMFASGGLALVLAQYWGWERTYQLMACLMLLNMLVTYSAPEAKEEKSLSKTSSQAVFFLEPFLDLWRRDNIILMGLFVIFYKAGAALAVALMTNFLLHGLGFSLVEIGVASKAVIIVGTILGAFVGGAFLLRLGLYASLLWFGLAQALSILLFMLLALSGKVFSLMVLTLFLENFCSGMSTAALMAFLMSLCHTRYSATQFAFLSAIDSLGRLLAGPLAAVLVTHYGWAAFYGWSFVVSLPALFLLLILGKRVSFDAPAISYS
jgi:PAT family beta-lactamase induction signal transducer AmpG